MNPWSDVRPRTDYFCARTFKNECALWIPSVLHEFLILHIVFVLFEPSSRCRIFYLQHMIVYILLYCRSYVCPMNSLCFAWICNVACIFCALWTVVTLSYILPITYDRVYKISFAILCLGYNTIVGSYKYNLQIMLYSTSQILNLKM